MSATIALLGVIALSLPCGAIAARLPPAGMALFAKGYPHARIKLADVYLLTRRVRPTTVVFCGHFTARPDPLAVAGLETHQFAYFPGMEALWTEHVLVDANAVLRDDEVLTRLRSATADRDQALADSRAIGYGATQAFEVCGFGDDGSGI